MSDLSRRDFLETSAATLAAAALAQGATPPALPDATPAQLPRWRGFNLLEKFVGDRNAPFVERDFAWLAEWGFNFVRLPLSYRCWSTAEAPREMREAVLAQIDQAVEWGRQYGLHVNLNLHRAPGYCVNPPAEPRSLWHDEAALEDCAFVWSAFAKRYRSHDNAHVSFDLLNEPGALPAADYVKVVKRLAAGIRAEDPDRLVIADGLKWGNEPVPDLAGVGLGQSTRGYTPMEISHYQANWVRGSDQWPTPTWPLKGWDKARLAKERIEPWQRLAARGVGVHVGEWGAFNRTPHAVALAWMKDCLELWRTAGWGWALWNLRGSFGVVDSGRTDVHYEDWQGHRLDRAMLDLLRAG